MKIVVGCPTRNRTWILEKWRDHVELATPGNWDLEYLFVVGDNDRETIEMLSSWKRANIIYVEEQDPGMKRTWNSSRYDHMVFLRNTLLDSVRHINPDLFLSLDSDILLGQNTLREMYETAVEYEFDAVGGLTWLDPIDPKCTNIASWVGSDMKGFKRVISRGHHKVDIIMAIKLMLPSAYNVEYAYHRMGEDLGWSKNMFLNQKRIGMDGRTPSKHIMKPEYLNMIDKRLSW
jgi:hypothetical protein